MFKLTTSLVCIFVISVRSAPLEPEVAPSVVPIISEENVVEPDGKFHYSFETGDGIKAHEEGTLKEVDKELVETVQGGFEYTAPDGKEISISYSADETGYHPVGDSIPVTPPVPLGIVKLIQYLEEHPEPEETTSLVKKV